MGMSVITRPVAARTTPRVRVSVMNIRVIAGLTFQEAARRKILWAAFLLGLAFLVLYAWGLHTLIRSEGPFSGANRLVREQVASIPLMMGLYAVNYLMVIMTVLTSVDTLAGEISSGTMQAVATKPVSRWEIVLGKWLGFVAMITLYIILMAGGIILMAGGVLGVTYFLSGYTPPHVLRGLSLIWLESLLLLSVTFLWGTSFSTLTTGVLTFGLQGLAFIGGWMEQFGAMAQKPVAVNIGIVASLIMPSESLWRRAAFEMQSSLVRALGFSPFGGASVPSAIMIVYAGVYLAVALSLAVRRFSRRDL